MTSNSFEINESLLQRSQNYLIKMDIINEQMSEANKKSELQKFIEYAIDQWLNERAKEQYFKKK